MKTELTVILLALTINCFGQSKFGIQIEMGVNSISGISSDTIVPYGLSGATYSIRHYFYASPSLRFRKNIDKRFSLETGIGYLPVKHRIRLQFYDDFSQINVDTYLNIKLHYLSIPIACNYSIPLSSSTALLFTVAANADILFFKKDNFQDIILEEIGWIERDWYTRIVFVPCLTVGYQVNISDMGIAELGLFASRDVNPFVNEKGWGFYENLKSAHRFRYGLQLKYFLNL